MSMKNRALSEEKAEYAYKALEAYGETIGEDVTEDAMVDLLADMMHLCRIDSSFGAFGGILERAKEHFQYEAGKGRY